MQTLEQLEKEREALKNRLQWAEINTCQYTLEHLRLQIHNTEALIAQQQSEEPPDQAA